MFVPGSPMAFYAPESEDFGHALQVLIGSTDERDHVKEYLAGFKKKRFGKKKVRWLDIGNAGGTMNPFFLEHASHLITLEPNEFLHAQAVQHYRRNRRVTAMRGRAEEFRLGERQEKADIATILFADHHFAAPLRVIARQIIPAVAKGGYIVIVNNGLKSPAHQLHQRLGYVGPGLAIMDELCDHPEVDRVERKTLVGPRWLAKDEGEVFTFTRFIAGDHQHDYAFATEAGFKAAVRELFLPEAIRRPKGLPNPHQIVTIKLK